MEQNYHLKSILILFLLIFSLCCVPLQAKEDIENPYGGKNWKLESVNLSIITERRGSLEMNDVIHINGDLTIDIVNEDKNWATINVSITDCDKQVIDNLKLSFKVDKSSNIAYSNDNNIGFFPFYLFKFNDPSFLDGNWEKEIVLDQEYTIDYFTNYNVEFPKDHHVDEKTLSIDEPALRYESKRKISYIFNTSSQTREMTPKRLSMGARGSYPFTIEAYLSAGLFINNVTDERYVCVDASLGRDQDDAVDYLNSLDIQKMNKKDDEPYDILGPALISLVIGSGIVLGYLAYRKQR